MATQELINPLDYREWSVTKRFDIPLFINQPIAPGFQFVDGVALDEEDDEKGNFVGLGIYDGFTAWYWSDWNLVKQLIIPKFLAHNGKTDLWKLKKWGFNVNSSYLLNDTIIASYVCDITAKSHSLKTYAVELGMPYPKYEDIVGKGKTRKTLDKQDLQLVAEYNACDTVATWKLWEKFQREMTIEQINYYNGIEMPIYRLLYKMQEQGVKTDTNLLTNLERKFSKELEQLESKLKLHLGDNLNLRSSKQLKEVLKLPDVRKQTLQSKNSPLIQDLLRYKKLNKMVSTYIKPYIEGNGTLNPEFNQVAYSKESKDEEGIRTGRLSSRNPNFQNLPSHTTEGIEIRKTIIPNSGNTFILADYSQIELRVLAHFCEDKRMVRAFNEGRDIHEETSKAIGCDRSVAKTLNFALVYGSGAWNLSQKTGISSFAAKQFLDRFDREFPGVSDWKKLTLYKARQNGHVTTLLGRRIKWEIWSNCKKHALKSVNNGSPCGNECAGRLQGEADRRAISAIVQGSAAEIIKVAMLKLDSEGFKFPVQEHDALLFEIPNFGENGGSKAMIKLIMENVIKLKVPLLVDIKTGNSWGEAKKG